jgi:hypothetical protein
MGVKLISLDEGATVVAVAHNGESTDSDDDEPAAEGDTGVAAPAVAGSDATPVAAPAEDEEPEA